MRRCAAAFVLLLCALAPLGRAQSGGVIPGRVVAADTGDPLSNARVIVKTTRELPRSSPMLTVVSRSLRPPKDAASRCR